MKKSVLIIKGYSKTDIELINDRKIIQLYIDFFCSNAGGAFDFDTEINVLEEPEVETLQNLNTLNKLNYLIVVLIGHGANKDGAQIFQLQKNTFIQPGQIQFECKKQLHIIETCRNVIDFELDIKRLNRLIPKYAYGGTVKQPLTREESRERFDYAVSESDNGTIYLFAASVDESAYGYLFLKLMIDKAIYIHEYYRESIVNVSKVFELAKKQVNELTEGKQTPMIDGKNELPFVITII
ncbi:hypothetical protein MHM83_07750 [Tenacibaculum sp. Mcav3-52]|uniref:hypothetical protein n=1 Tax=Tenacibaculum sp. Mcav3-52 TaxID=2917762 RepID=UPI001EF30AB0|nr:hypothetical protein [Tenacibaculum sp. Mcav3-52]MCG7501762.1 hypothetical protein [Tenacibaculum sp. Mcav3-52]